MESYRIYAACLSPFIVGQNTRCQTQPSNSRDLKRNYRSCATNIKTDLCVFIYACVELMDCPPLQTLLALSGKKKCRGELPFISLPHIEKTGIKS